MKYFIRMSLFALFIAALSVISCAEDKPKMSHTVKESVNHIVFDTSKINRTEVDCSIRAIAPIDGRSCWFAGSKGQYGFTLDGGDTWHIDSIQNADQPNLEFRSIAYVQGSIFLLSIASPALLYKTSNNGADWEIVYRENDTSAFYDAMAFWDENEGMAMGDPTEGCLSVIKTKDGGKHWEKISCDILPRTATGEAAFAASNSNLSLVNDHVWLVSGGGKARVFHSPDKGESWSVYPTPIVQGGKMTGIFSCDFFDENIGVIIGGDWENKDVNRRNKALTKDGGKTWTLLADGNDPGYRSCIQFFGEDASRLIAVGIPGISISEDMGYSWNKLSDESFYTVRRSDNALWLAGPKKIARWQL